VVKLCISVGYASQLTRPNLASQIRVPTWRPRYASQIRVPNEYPDTRPELGGYTRPELGGSKIGVRIRVPNELFIKVGFRGFRGALPDTRPRYASRMSPPRIRVPDTRPRYASQLTRPRYASQIRVPTYASQLYASQIRVPNELPPGYASQIRVPTIVCVNICEFVNIL
jgi:hypothetical protein